MNVYSTLFFYIVLVVVSSGDVVVAFFLFYNHFQYFFAVLCTYLFGLFFNHPYHENIILNHSHKKRKDCLERLSGNTGRTVDIFA